jgi:hypothetical protein
MLTETRTQQHTQIPIKAPRLNAMLLTSSSGLVFGNDFNVSK